MCKPQKMSTTDKYWYIKEHWNEYEAHTKATGSAVGFAFPDGSKVEATDDDLMVY